MDDLVRWLGVQLDEDERIARAADPGPWKSESLGRHDQAAIKPAALTSLIQFDGSRAAANGMHVSRHDPARVLREIDATRRIVEIHRVVGFEDEDMTDLGSGCSECGYSAEYGDRGGWCETLRLLAAPYADRPGFRKEWRP